MYGHFDADCMWLWSNPDLPHWQRLLLGVYYLPLLFWWWLTGKTICLMTNFHCEWDK